MKNNKSFNPMSKEFQDECKRLGLTGFQLVQKYRKEGNLPDHTDIENKRIEKFLKDRGFKTINDYRNDLAKKDGFKNYHEKRNKNYNLMEYQRELSYRNCVHKPMSDNPDCASYIGVYIGEELAKDILIEKFGGIEKKMPYKGYPYDYIAKGAYKIQVKTSTLKGQDCSTWEGWNFPVDYNKYTDYFLLLALDKERKLVYKWLIHKNDLVRSRKFWQRTGMCITNKPERLTEFDKYLL